MLTPIMLELLLDQQGSIQQAAALYHRHTHPVNESMCFDLSPNSSVIQTGAIWPTGTPNTPVQVLVIASITLSSGLNHYSV
jgi:hypothetical protein